MALADYLKGVANWIGYHLWRGKPFATARREAARRFGDISPPDVEEAAVVAKRRTDAAERLAAAPPGEPIFGFLDPLDDVGPVVALRVLMKLEKFSEQTGGVVETSWRTISVTVPREYSTDQTVAHAAELVQSMGDSSIGLNVAEATIIPLVPDWGY